MSARIAAPMDDEQVIAAVQAAQGVAVNLLGMVGGKTIVEGYVDTELGELANDAAEVLHALLDWKGAHDDEDAALFKALESWLP